MPSDAAGQMLIPTAPDSQITELLGRNRLVNELLSAGLEVALPLRDRGIDLIAYTDIGSDLSGFFACPVQMKSSRSASFGLDRKYEKIHNLILAFIWYIEDPRRTQIFAMTYAEAEAIVEAMGWSKTASWRCDGRYVLTRAVTNKKLAALLEKHQMSPTAWRDKVLGASQTFPLAMVRQAESPRLDDSVTPTR